MCIVYDTKRPKFTTLAGGGLIHTLACSMVGSLMCVTGAGGRAAQERPSRRRHTQFGAASLKRGSPGFPSFWGQGFLVWAHTCLRRQGLGQRPISRIKVLASLPLL